MPPRAATPQRRSRAEYQAKYPKAVASLNRDQEKRLTCVDVSAAHGIHVRTTNPVESPFSTVRLRQRVTKGAGSRTKGVVMAYTLLVMAEARWRKLNAPHLLPLVQAKVQFVDGTQPRRNKREGGKDAA
jgi:transposase-like protein